MNLWRIFYRVFANQQQIVGDEESPYSRNGMEKDVDTILQERKKDLIPRPNENFIDQKNRADRFERELEKFHKWMVGKGYKINTARSYCTSVLQLFRYYSMPIALRTGSPISQITVSTGDFNLKPHHVRAMFHVAKDLRSKLLILR